MNGGVVGVFIAPTTKCGRWKTLSVRWRTGQSGAHRTVRCPLPRQHCRWILTVGASDCGPAWMSGVHRTWTVHCPVHQNGRAWRLRATGAHWMRLQVAVGAEVAVAPWFTGQSGVHRTVRWIIAERLQRIPEAGEFRRPRFHGAPEGLRLPLCSFVESKTWSFYWLSVNLLHLYNLFTWAN
jgi:hypothetical protein